jgi:hypothetical protein
VPTASGKTSKCCCTTDLPRGSHPGIEQEQINTVASYFPFYGANVSIKSIEILVASVPP